ncbi:MAG: winged helix DNA-binding domain-containing protein [Candidatus Limnocylindria bacterium]
MTQVLTQRELNRSLLARQLLLERSPLSVPKALEQLGGIQAQYAPSSYVRLWSCLRPFAMGDLDRLLEQRKVVQGTLMRSTIHLVSARDYWRFAEGIGPSRQDWWHQTWGREFERAEIDQTAARLDAQLTGRQWPRKELDERMRSHSSTVWSGAWVALIRVPPSGTWKRRRADLFQRAAEWIGPSDADERIGLQHLLRRFLGGFGPARLADAAGWAGVPVAKMKSAAEEMTLRRFRDEQGRELVDLPRAPLPVADAPAPIRFLPTWDATLLVHSRQTQILPEAYRPLIFNTRTPHSVGTFLVDGSVAGRWRGERSGQRATLVYTPFERLPSAAERELRDEAAGLIRFVEADASEHKVTREVLPA